ncbi:MAG: hypothetical protein JO369_07470 [Paucibacter sp.]|nr:hypothetical protein [Roseateles sp.]
MTVDISTTLSGISAANERLRAAASNIASMADANQTRTQANLSTVQGGGVRADLVQTKEPIRPANEIVDQQAATYDYVANLKMLKTEVRAEGAILDIHA